MSDRPQLQHLSRRDPLDRVASALDADGGVIVEGMLDAAQLAALDAELQPHIDAADPEMEHLNPAIGFFFGKRTRHVSGVASKSRTFATDVLCHPVLTQLADRVLGPSCANYQLNVGHLLDRGPGSEAQLLHRDEDVWVHLPRPHPEVELSSLTALVDFREENGATWVVPGSHRWPREREAQPHEIAIAQMPAGSSVIYLGSTIHAAGTNSSEERRPGLHMSFVVGWLRTEENNMLATPAEVARELPRRAQELLGYAAHDAIADAGGYLGAVDLRDPVDMLADGSLGGAAKA